MSDNQNKEKNGDRFVSKQFIRGIIEKIEKTKGWQKFAQSRFGVRFLEIKAGFVSFLKEMLDLDKQEYGEFRQFFRFSFFLFVVFFISGGFVFAVLMNSQEEKLVPNVIDKNVLVAMEDIYKEGFNVKVEPIHSNSVSKYIVIDQRPHAGIGINEGRSIILTVSMGKNIDAMPQFIGKDISKAQAEVIDMFSQNEDIPNLVIKKISSKDIPKDKIIDQSPLPGSPLNSKVNITFVVSSGKVGSVFIVKNYVGQFYQDVVRDIENVGIHVKIVPVEASDKTQIGKIIEQDVPTGASLFEGADITLKVWINSSADKISSSDNGDGVHFIETYTVPEIVRYNPKIDRILSRGMALNHPYAFLVFGVEDSLGKRTYYRSFVRRGQKIDFPYEMYGQGSIFITLDGEKALDKKVF